MEATDRVNFGDKLKGYVRVKVEDLKSNDHVRYVKKKYGTDNEYKCVYAIVDSCELGQDMSVHGYNPDPKEAPHSWVLSGKSIPYTRFYKKA